MNKPKFETPNLTDENVAKIAELFPGVVTEGKVNFELLRAMLGDKLYGDEAYEFTWVGKRAAIAEAGRPIRKTLRPCVEESKAWDTTENLYIEGDNLDVLKLLQESYLGKVKMVYIDPPYNTGNDFVYRDDFKQSLEEYAEELGEYDEAGDRLIKNTETNGRFHSDWCSMMYPRIVLARNMLRDDGVIFISIDDNEVAQLQKICDEVFGESNFVVQMVRKSKSGAGHDSKYLAVEYEYCLVYCKNLTCLQFNREVVDTDTDKKYKLVDEFVNRRGRYYLRDLDYKGTYSQLLDYPITTPNGNILWSGGKQGAPNTWRWSKKKFEWGVKHGFIVFKDKKVYIKQYQFVDNKDEIRVRSIPYRAYMEYLNSEATQEAVALFGNLFSYPKPVSMLKYLLNVSTGKDDLVLDFFSGSAVTAHAVMQLNAEDGGKRKFIMVQLPEITDEKSEAFKAGYKNICEIGKERIRRAGDKIKADNVGKEGIENLDIGFRVLKLDDTNMNDVYYAASEYTQGLLPGMINNVKPDRTDMDLLFACLLDWHLPLNMPHTHEKIDGFAVHTYNDGDLIACFEESVSEKAIRELASRKPLRAVFRDSSFNSSPEKINVFEIFKLLAPNTKVKVM